MCIPGLFQFRSTQTYSKLYLYRCSLVRTIPGRPRGPRAAPDDPPKPPDATLRLKYPSRFICHEKRKPPVILQISDRGVRRRRRHTTEQQLPLYHPREAPPPDRPHRSRFDRHQSHARVTVLKYEKYLNFNLNMFKFCGPAALKETRPRWPTGRRPPASPPVIPKLIKTKTKKLKA